MRYLIDSNILTFYGGDQDQLEAEVKDILGDYSNRIYVPSKCVEELIYLHQSGKIEVDQWKSADDIIDFIVKESDFEIKYAKEEHLRTLAKLPLFPDHKDQTDRIIVAQAITERIPMVSCDRKFFSYVRHGLNFVYNDRSGRSLKSAERRAALMREIN